MKAAMLYDGFAPSALYWLESAGFCGPGEAFDFIADGRIAADKPRQRAEQIAAHMLAADQVAA